MQEISPTPYWPFDGSNQSASDLPLISTSNSSAAKQPILYPSQAFFLGRCAKSMYLNISTFYTAVDPNSNITFGTIATQNLVNRFSVQGSYTSPVKFKAKVSGSSTTLFQMEFYSGAFGLGTLIGNTKIYGFLPNTSIKVAGSEGYLEQSLLAASVGNISFEGFPSFREGAIIGIGFHGVGSTPDINLTDVSVLKAELRLTERIDNIYFTLPSWLGTTETLGYVYPGTEVAIVCPPTNTSFNTTAYRTGFADVKSLLITGVNTPLTPGTTASTTQFTLSSIAGTGSTNVKDIIRFIVPNGAVTGHVSFITTTDVNNASNTSDYFKSPVPLIIN